MNKMRGAKPKYLKQDTKEYPERETIHFKSDPFYFETEQAGRKPNTIRKFDLTDKGDSNRLAFLYTLLNRNLGKLERALNTEYYIIIENTETTETFTRRITDVSEWNEYFIISWQHTPTPLFPLEQAGD